MSPLFALLLGVIEGLTEFIPVSSTGHLILLGSSFAGDDPVVKTMEIVIQLGAVLAVVVHYRALLGDLVRGVLRRDRASLRLVAALAIAFVPAAIVGLTLHHAIEKLLFGARPVAIALIVGGVAMIIVEQWLKRRPHVTTQTLDDVTPLRALVVGLFQCLSLWPGMSRSMTTILGGQVAGLKTPVSAEFSFLLCVPVLGAATLYDLAKGWRGLLEAPGGLTSLGVGLVSAFIVSLFVIRIFIGYLKRFGLTPFGVYRILLGGLVLALTLR
jgi:undecaprenyl-diphosphatase